MVRVILQKITKKSKFTFFAFADERNHVVIETVMNDYRTKDHNPCNSKYRSFKGILG